MKLLSLLLISGAMVGSSAAVSHSSEMETGWTIKQTLTKMQFETDTGIAKRSGVSRQGLVSVTKTGGRIMETFWEPSAFSQTITLDGKMIIDGYDLDRVSRIRSLRMNKSGSVAFLESGKGPKSKVTLIQDKRSVFKWPIASNISLIHFDEKQVIFSQQTSKSVKTKFGKFALNNDGSINPTSMTIIGELDNCIFLSAKPFQSGLAIEAICGAATGKSIYFLQRGKSLKKIAVSNFDEDLHTAMLKGLDKHLAKNMVGVLSVEGSPAAMQFYHAVNSSLLRDLGEPMSFASDEAGKQAWSQSYRSMALAQIYNKSRHPVFAALANRAMENTINSQNRHTGITGPENPSCAWASRIYSEDKKTPLSFMINQGMIGGSLIQTCNALGKACSKSNREKIEETAICLAGEYEKYFDKQSGLYRIPKNIPFRFDGIWSPWNWQLSFAYVLQHAGLMSGEKKWNDRVAAITDQFYDSIKYETSGSIWRYWTPQYYDGWEEEDQISIHRVKFKPKENERFEDINHAGISLMALCELPMPKRFKSASKTRLETILDDGLQLPRDMDGSGPRNPKWFPASGWDCLGSKKLEKRFSRYLPYAAGGSKHAAYSRLFDPAKPFDLTLKLSACDLEKCEQVKTWEFNSQEEYLAKSPFFQIIKK